MSFFQGAKNVQVYGGDFTSVNGDLTVYDQSRHTSNVSSFNVTNNTMANSFNNNSQQYYNRRDQRPLPQGQRSQMNTSTPDESHLRIPNPPASTVQHAPENVYDIPPGSTANNYNYMNAVNNNIRNSFEDNSQLSNGTSKYKNNMADCNRSVSGSGTMAMASTLRMQYAGTSASSTVAEGDLSPMSPSIQHYLDKVMKQVRKETSPKYSKQTEIHKEKDSDSGDSDSEGEVEEVSSPEERPSNKVHAQHRLAQLSFEDTYTGPAYSRTKSAPQDPEYDFTSKSQSSVVDSSWLDPPPQQGISNGYLKQQAPPPYQSGPSQPFSANLQMFNTFGSAAVASSNYGGPSYTTINGPYTKYDYRHHITNVDSGNVNNMQIQESFNDASTDIVSPPERGSKSRRLGKKIRRDS